MDITVLGIDLGKSVCSLAGLDASVAVIFRKRLQRLRPLYVRPYVKVHKRATVFRTKSGTRAGCVF